MEKGKTRKRNKKEQDWLRYQLYQGNCYANDAGSHNPKMPVENFEVARDISPQSCYLDADFSNICFRCYIFAHGFADCATTASAWTSSNPAFLSAFTALYVSNAIVVIPSQSATNGPRKISIHSQCSPLKLFQIFQKLLNTIGGVYFNTIGWKFQLSSQVSPVLVQ